MRITVQKPLVNDPRQLEKQLVSIQDDINRALDKIGFSAIEKILLTSVKEESFPLYITNKQNGSPWGLHMVYIKNLTDPDASPMVGVHTDWIAETGKIKIRSVSGLVAGNVYEMRFLLLYA